jgi:hypothetical protein
MQLGKSLIPPDRGISCTHLKRKNQATDSLHLLQSTRYHRFQPNSLNSTYCVVVKFKKHEILLSIYRNRHILYFTSPAQFHPVSSSGQTRIPADHKAEEWYSTLFRERSVPSCSLYLLALWNRNRYPSYRLCLS